jgi:hypothetical protein
MRSLMIVLALAAAAPAAGQPVFPSTPDWESFATNHYSTGAAFADINGDGRLDIVISDGNDIVPGRLNVYLNDGDGGFPTTPSWTSNDVRLNGHLDVADVNGDGWLDVAVAHLGDSGTTDAIARVYLNNNGTLSSLADWEADIIGNAFGVAFGDVNNDGRPDLAVATGWSYGTPHQDANVMYVNVDGLLEASPSWVSDDTFDSQGTIWVDADNDGWLDLVMISSRAETRLYRNLGGTLETTASWTTTDSPDQDAIMACVGDVTGDGVTDLFVTDNTQLGGSGRFRQYTGLALGMFETTYSWSYFDGNGSAVALADVNGDGRLDLATGAWWDHTRLFFNTGTGLPSTPDWSSGVTSVVEKIVFGDVDPACGVEAVYTARLDADGDRQLFPLPRQPIERLLEVRRDDLALGPGQYTFHREHGWITVDAPPVEALEIDYTASSSLDMVVSNWDSNVGNFLYYSSVIDDCNDNGIADGCDVAGGESADVNMNGIPDECECLADFAEPPDGMVNVFDLLALLDAWGQSDVPQDLDGDGTVNVFDLLILLEAWGPCP